MPENVKLDKTIDKIEKTKKIDFLGKNFSGKDEANAFLKTADAIEKLKLKIKDLNKVKEESRTEYEKLKKLEKENIDKVKKGTMLETKRLEVQKKIDAKYKTLRVNYQKTTKELKNQNKEYEKTSSNYKQQKTALQQMIDVEGVYIKMLNSKNVAFRKVGALLSKGKEDVEEYTKAIEKSGGKSIVFGAAAYYMAEKISELGERVEETAKAFATFDVRMASIAGATLIAPGGVKQLEEIRSELHLTTADFQEFTDIAINGVNSGAISMEGMVGSLEKLHETFGRNQFEKLKEMTELLKSIPTLETDLNINANLDDQAASWFALAKKGKVTEAIELQNAGLLGGEEKKLEGVDKQIEMLKGIHHAEKLLEDIKKTVASAYSFFGAIGPEISMISSTLLSIGTGVGGLLTFAGGMRAIFGKLMDKKEESAIKLAIDDQKTADRDNAKFLAQRFAVDTNRVVRAILTKTDIGGSNLAIDGDRKGKTKGGRAGKASSIGGFLKGGIGKLSAGGMIAGLIAQPMLSMAEDHFKQSGNTTGEKISQGAGIATGIGGSAATGAWMGGMAGSVIPVVGNAVGAAAGGIIGGMYGVYSEWSEIVDLSSSLFEKDNNAIKGILSAREKEKLSILAAQEARQQSALEMQKYLNMVENAANTEKASLVNEQLETLGKEFENLENVGGSVKNFDEIIQNSTIAIGEKFNLLSQGFESVRKKIYEDSKLQSVDRKNMLMMLHKKELDAVKEFSERLLNLVGEFDKIPEIIINKLQNTIAKTKIDLGVQTSGISRDTMFSELDKVIENQIENLGIVFDQYGKDIKTTHSTSKQMLDKNDETKSSIKAGIEDIGGWIGDELRSVFSFDENDMKVDENAKSKLKEKLNQRMDLNNKDIEQLGELPKLLGEEDALRKEMGKTFKQTDVRKEVDGEKDEEKKKELIKQHEDVLKEPLRKEVDIQQDIAQKQKEIAQYMQDNYKSYDYENKATIDILGIAKQQAQVNREYKTAIDKGSIELEKANQILNDSTKLINGGVETQKQINKSTTALFDNVKEFITTIEELSSLVGKSVESQNASADVELLSAQTDSYIAAGRISQLNSAILKKNVASIKENSTDLNEIYKRLEETEKATSNKADFIKKTRDNFIKMTDELNKDFTDGNVFSKSNLTKEMGSDEAGEALHSSFIELIKNSLDISELANKKDNTQDATEKEKIKEEILKREKSNAENEKKINGLILKSNMGPEHKQYLKSKIQEVKQNQNAEVAFKATVDKIGLEKYQLSKASADIANQMLKLVDIIAEMPSKIDEAFNIKTFSSVREAATAMAELSAESWNFTKTAEESGIALDNQKKKYKSAMDKLNELSNPEEMKNATNELIKQYEQMVENAKTPEDKATAQSQLDSIKDNASEYIISRQKLEVAKQEKELKDQIVSAAERERKAKEEQVDMQIGLVTDTISYMEEMGASVGDIMDMRKQAIGMKAQKVGIIQEQFDKYAKEFEEAKMGGNVTQQDALRVKMEQTRTELVKEQMSLQKEALGAQRDAYEKMLGLAFGEIRQARGARKGMMSDASIHGKGFVKQAGTDMIIAGSAGQSQTLDERSQQYQAEIGGVKSMKEIKSDVESITGVKLGTDSPSKIDLKTTKEGESIDMLKYDKKELKNKKEEIKLDVKGNKIKKEENRSDEKSPILDLPKNDNSGITSTVELGQKQLTVQEEIRDVLLNQYTTSQTKEANAIKQGVLEDNGNSKLMGIQSNSGDMNVAYTSVKGYEQFDRKPTQVLPKDPISSSSEVNSNVTVGGEVVVKFDNKMFEQAVVNIVSTNSTVTNSLTNRFDNRYVKA